MIVLCQSGDEQLAQEMFTLMAEVFEEEHSVLAPRYLEQLLDNPRFWAFVALSPPDSNSSDEGKVIGGLTAHVLPATRSQFDEEFLYDIAVHPQWQRKGVGRELVDNLLAKARSQGIDEVFVPADNEDLHALDFYRKIISQTGGEASSVTFFSF